MMSDEDARTFGTISRVGVEIIINSEGLRWSNWYRDPFDPTIIANDLFRRHGMEFVIGHPKHLYTDASMSVTIDITPMSMNVVDSSGFMVVNGRVGVSVNILLATEEKTLFRWYELRESRKLGASIIKPMSEDPLLMFESEVGDLIVDAYTDALLRLQYEAYGIGEIARHLCFETDNYVVARLAHDWLFPSDYHTRTTRGRYPSWIDSPVDTEELIRLLDERNCLPQRVWASAALWKQGDIAAIDGLIDALNDPFEDVRLNCRDALRKITGEKLGLNQKLWRDWWAKEQAGD